MAERSTNSEDEGSDSDRQFVVEVIKAARVKDGQWEYRVKWANYDSAEDSWEPVENLNCPRLFKSFWGDIGTDDEDYYEGYEVQATPSWIKREKKYFARSIGQKKETSEDDDSEPMPQLMKERPVVKDRGKYKGKYKAVTKKPRLNQRRKAPKTKIPRKQEPRPVAAEGSDSSDNTPLSVRKGKMRARVAIDSSDEEQPSTKIKQPKPTIKIPPSVNKSKATQGGHDPDHSESAGSLFSDKDRSSPEIALNSLPAVAQPTTKSSTIPMKRSSIDDGTLGQRKRQIMEMPMPITATTGNATKARLAQRVSQTAGPSAASGVYPAIQKTDLSKLTFKKNAITAAVASPVLTNSPVAPSPTTVPSLPRRSTSISDHAQSPGPSGLGTSTYEIHSLIGASPTLPSQEPRRNLPLPRRTLTAPAPGPATNDTMAETEKLLSGIMPPSMAVQMQDDTPADMPPPPVPIRPAMSKTMSMSLPRIQKKWKWTGDIFMDVSRDRAEPVCQAVFSDATDPLPNGLRFGLCLSGDSIRFSAFQYLASLSMFLLASARPQQFAKVGPLEDKDKDVVNQLGNFMKKKAYFCFAHLYMDEVSVALLIMYPTGHSIVDTVLRVPPELSMDCALQVALVPWELTSKEFHAANWRPRSSTVEPMLDPDFVPVLDDEGRGVLSSRRFYEALHILGFPKALYDFMSQQNRPYCVYSPSDTSDKTAAPVEYETSLLKAVLSRSNAKDVGHKEHVRIVFVHVGALGGLYRLPALAERRSKRPELRFVTYGTHPSVPRERWGMREIYPLGGIVTFTPSAILEGHYRVLNRIKQIAEHPLWDCYVLPSVVAMVAKLTCQGLHPLRVYDEDNFVYKEVLTAIEQGDLALLHAPELVRDTVPGCDTTLQWTRWMLRLPTMNARQILEECLKLAAEQFANTSDADLPMAIEKELARDFMRMQIQPAIMDKYRRFVIVKSKNDKYLINDKCGIESATIEDLDFKDDYFQRERTATTNDPAKR